MKPRANQIKWAVYGAIIGLIFGATNVNFWLLDGLRSFGFNIPELGTFGSIMLWAVFGGLAAVVRNWWRSQR